jgi:hypothetical protein
VRRALAVTAVAAAALAFVPHALALSKPRADAAALRALRPQTLSGRVALFGLPHALKKTDLVSEGMPPGAGKPLSRGQPVGRKAWLYWEDLQYGAFFEHRSVVVLVDDATGRVLRRTAFRSWPLVNNRSFFLTGYRALTHAIYSNIRPGKRVHAARAPSAVTSVLAQRPNCLLIVTPPDGTDDPTFERDAAAWTSMANRIGVAPYRVWGGGIEGEPGADKDVPAAGADLEKTVDQARAKGCKDIAIVVNAHSFRPDEQAGIHTGNAAVDAGNGKVKLEPRAITPDDLKKLLRDNLKKHPNITFKFVFDTCFAGRTLDPIDQNQFPNLIAKFGASNKDQPSWGFGGGYTTADGKFHKSTTNNPGNTNAKKTLGEFTNGMLSGIAAVEGSKAGRDKIKNAGWSALANLLGLAFDQESKQDFAVQLKLTTPSGKLRKPIPPDMFRIEATFIPAAFATSYTVDVTHSDPRPLRYRWVLQPPQNDPNCKLFAQDQKSPAKAVWFHGDQHGCDHTKAQGPAGHEGVVEAIVEDGLYRCHTTYFGTVTGRSGPSGCEWTQFQQTW